jgi:hypothetical protein
VDDSPREPRQIHQNVVEEAVRLLAAAEQAELSLRALGGVAVFLHVGELLHPAFAREIQDIDLATKARQSRDVTDLVKKLGYTERGNFNALHGARRLLFYDGQHGRKLDVFVGTFEMCHVLPLEDRLTVDPLTIPLAELLLTKLQIVRFTRKDILDVCSLLLTHELDKHDNEAINIARISSLCGADWGLYHTVERNLESLRNGLAETGVSEDERQVIRERVGEIAEALAAAHKSPKWKLRARVGERVRWYEDPEEVEG